MTDWGVETKGGGELAAAFAAAGPRATWALTVAMVQETQLMMAESQKQVPVGKTGNLKNSGTILPPRISGTTVSITLGYGGAAAKYAVYVHNAAHEKNWTKPGTKSHFLSDPVKDAMGSLESRIAERMKDIIK